MRLREFTQDYVKNQSSVLMTILQRHKSQSEDPVKVPFDDIVAAMNKAGYDFDHAKFVDLYNTVPSISNLIASPDEKEVMIGQADQRPAGTQDPASVVDKMASKAADKAMQ